MTEMLNQDSRPEEAQGLTREAWLHRAIEAFRPRFTEIGLPLPDKVHVSVGFGYSSRAESKYILGQCWAPAATLISLLHELIHAADDCQSGHKGAFAEAATRLDPTTADVPVPVPPGAAPAPDPGGKVHSGPGKQGTRMIKLTTQCCGYTVRTTRKWLDQGYPLCPHGQPMHQD
jgi:hypothetical protein